MDCRIKHALGAAEDRTRVSGNGRCIVKRGHSRLKNDVASFAYLLGIHVFTLAQGVDGRDTPGVRPRQINVTEPSHRVRRPHPSGDLSAPFAFDHRNIVLALEIEPELRAVAEIAPKANGRIGCDRTPAVQYIRYAAGWHADVERQPVRAQFPRSQLTLQ
jgi:hypothetical protein